MPGSDIPYGGSVSSALPAVNVPPAPPDAGGMTIGGGILSGAGSLLSSGINLFSAYQNRKWQEKMANTAHQREVADLRAAGLNPILSATHGGAAVPSGGYGTMSNPLESVGSSMASAAQSKFTRENVLNQNLSTAVQYASALLDMQGKRQQNRITTAEADRQSMVNDKLSADIGLSRSSAAGIEAARAKDAAMQPLWDTLGEALRYGINKLNGLFPRSGPTGESIHEGNSAGRPLRGSGFTGKW